MVTFRVSADEYQSLEAACTARRVRSISESARAAVRQWIGEAPSSNALDGELQQVERSIQVLAKELDRLQHLARPQKSTPIGTTTKQ
jgi:hypothetical protein